MRARAPVERQRQRDRDEQPRLPASRAGGKCAKAVHRALQLAQVHQPAHRAHRIARRRVLRHQHRPSTLKPTHRALQLAQVYEAADRARRITCHRVLQHRHETLDPEHTPGCCSCHICTTHTAPLPCLTIQKVESHSRCTS